ncbi:MAG TPA: hypothetical protein IAA05_15975 [Candidatus Blautia excrementipullorum]|nr:hypothetical protein [Candidatus Blautia excrementipullorum]
MIEFDEAAVIRIKKCLEQVQVTGTEQAKNLVMIAALLETGKEKKDGVRNCRLDETERAGLELRKQKKTGRATRNFRIHRNRGAEHAAAESASVRKECPEHKSEQRVNECDGGSRE